MLFVVGIGLWIVGDVVWAVLAQLDLEPFPSVADAFYLLGYVCFAVGLYHLDRSRKPGGDRTGMIDAVVVGVAVSLAVTVLFIEPAWAAEGSALARSVGVAYPVAGVILLVLLTNLRTAGPGRTPALRLLSLALIATLIGDLLFQFAPHMSWLEPSTHLLDAAWLIGYLLLGAAALHPSMAAATARQPRRVQVVSLTSRSPIVPGQHRRDFSKSRRGSRRLWSARLSLGFWREALSLADTGGVRPGRTPFPLWCL